MATAATLGVALAIARKTGKRWRRHVDQDDD
jgi:hypothetical protein